jgi:hypothetical protein
VPDGFGRMSDEADAVYELIAEAPDDLDIFAAAALTGFIATHRRHNDAFFADVWEIAKRMKETRPHD